MTATAAEPGGPDAGALIGWYDRVRRPLPWRFTRDPYALLVSEVMLQQTQAARVVPYYERFLVRFPDVAALAGAPIADVLRAWGGLGYNRRALALRSAAQAVAEHGWPRTATGLEALPGVGRYTAAAVASFAWDEAVAAVDTNARRVLERFDGVERSSSALAARALALLPRDRAAAWNQAMMELGATLCIAHRPRCDACPVRDGCAWAADPSPKDPPRRARRGAHERFEDSDRWARGRIVAALLAGEGIPAEIRGARLERAVAGLEHDGLVVRTPGGSVGLP